ncbi:MAG: hypothetical protein ACI86M_003618, partial [Saprospiraceae bacterium]
GKNKQNDTYSVVGFQISRLYFIIGAKCFLYIL